MRILRAVSVATAITFASASASAAPALAGDSAAARVEAKKHFQRAVSLYEEQDFRGALAEFQRAYEIAPNYKVLYDVAQSHYQLQGYSKAIDVFEQYLKSGDRDIPRARRVEVEEALARLRTRVAVMTISVNVATAEVTVDDELVATQAGSATIRVNAGQHRVGVTAKGYVAASKVVTLVGEDKTDVHLDLEREVDTSSPALAPLRKELPLNRNQADRPKTLAPATDVAPSRTPFYIGVGVTSVLAAGAIGLGITSLVAKGTYNRALRSSTDSPSRIDDSRDLVRTTSLLADVLTVTAVAGGITTLVLYLKSGSHSAGPQAAAAIVGCPAGICGTF